LAEKSDLSSKERPPRWVLSTPSTHTSPLNCQGSREAEGDTTDLLLKIACGRTLTGGASSLQRIRYYARTANRHWKNNLEQYRLLPQRLAR
jgi:hypothetical protein